MPKKKGTKRKSDSTAKKASPKKKAKKSSWVDKVMAVFSTDDDVGKLGLASIKKKIEESCGLDMKAKKNKNFLKKALTKCVDDEKLLKIEGSYALPEWYNQKKKELEEHEEMTSRALDDPEFKYPVDYPWSGLRVIKQEKAKSNRSTCRACGNTIDKGASRMQVQDSCLYYACTNGEDTARPYIEGDYPVDVSKSKFFIHSSCKDLAEHQFEEQFHRDWKQLRPVLIADEAWQP